METRIKFSTKFSDGKVSQESTKSDKSRLDFFRRSDSVKKSEEPKESPCNELFQKQEDQREEEKRGLI